MDQSRVAERSLRTERASGTRELILAAAERLFAEHGLLTVSNRQVSEAAGQGNNTAVGYHFGTKADLVRAIVQKHSEAIEQIRLQLVTECVGSTQLRDWVGCLVRPLTDHLEILGSPSWYARFSVQVMADPALRANVIDDALSAPTIRATLDGLDRCLPALPPHVRAERGVMARHLIVHMCAEQERAVAEGAATLRPTWQDLGTGLIDAIVGLFLAPVTPT